MPTVPSWSASKTPDTLTGRLSRRYALVLLSVAALMVVDQAIIQPLLVRLNSYAPAINVAGRQRMLSQRLTKAALAMQAAGNAEQFQLRHEELSAALDQWSLAHATLRGGNGEDAVPMLDTREMHRTLAELEPHFQAMRTAASQLIAATVTAGTQTSAVQTIVAHEAEYLPVMDHVVTLLENEAGRQIVRLRICALSIASAVVALLVGLGWFVVRPATRMIHSQVDELESRIRERTAELVEVNQKLQREIDVREQVESKSRLLADQLAHAARVSTMSRLTAGLAHEVNQPLTAIANYCEACEVLAAGDEPSQRSRLRSNLEQAKLAALRAGQIVRRMRNFVRPNAGTTTRVDLHQLIQDVVQLCRFEAERAGVRLRIDLSAGSPIALVDPIQIQQVLVNLLQNAVQAMQSCEVDDRVLTISTADAHDHIEIVVADSGPGLSGFDLDSLFQPFYTTKPDGLGIGLSICRAIVQQHGGTIWADSPERGAAIYIHLPRSQTHDGPAPVDAQCVCG